MESRSQLVSFMGELPDRQGRRSMKLEKGRKGQQANRQTESNTHPCVGQMRGPCVRDRYKPATRWLSAIYGILYKSKDQNAGAQARVSWSASPNP